MPAIKFNGMYIESLRQKMRIESQEEVCRMNPIQLQGWNILSITGCMDRGLILDFPGAKRVRSLYFDDVVVNNPEKGFMSATVSEIQEAIGFSHEVGDEPLLIHCHAGISRSTAMAWIIVYDKLKQKPHAVRRSFEIVRKVRPILRPNLRVLRLGVDVLVPARNRSRIIQEFQDCLAELDSSEPASY
jgi:predicted protein tyrosine phosphatase